LDVKPGGRARGNRLWFVDPPMQISVGSQKQFLGSLPDQGPIPHHSISEFNNAVSVLDISKGFSDVLERDGCTNYLVWVFRIRVIKLELSDGKIGALAQLHRLPILSLTRFHSPLSTDDALLHCGSSSLLFGNDPINLGLGFLSAGFKVKPRVGSSVSSAFGGFGGVIGGGELQIGNKPAYERNNNQRGGKASDHLIAFGLNFLRVRLSLLKLQYKLMVTICAAVSFGLLAFRSLSGIWNDRRGVSKWNFVFAVGWYVMGQAVMYLLAVWVYSSL
jgi:hypothetical protein